MYLNILIVLFDIASVDDTVQNRNLNVNTK